MVMLAVKTREKEEKGGREGLIRLALRVYRIFYVITERKHCSDACNDKREGGKGGTITAGRDGGREGD